MTDPASPRLVRLRIYLGEDKRDGDQALYQRIIRQARHMHIAGATVLRGTQGFGRSTRLHSADILFSDDLPVVIELIDHAETIERLVALLDDYDAIGLITEEPVTPRGRRARELAAPTAQTAAG
jgi:PII-like signaling protein